MVTELSEVGEQNTDFKLFNEGEAALGHYSVLPGER